jgi:hypothetical protein
MQVEVCPLTSTRKVAMKQPHRKKTKPSIEPVARPTRIGDRPPDPPESGVGLHGGSSGTQPLRIVMVWREALLLTYVWHLSAFFAQLCPSGRPDWKYWSYNDLLESSGTSAAAEAVRWADWVMFCQATPASLPPHVRHWAEGWSAPERETRAFVGFLSLTGSDSGFEDEALVCLRKLARKADRRFVAVRDFLSVDRSAAARDVRQLRHARWVCE